MWSRPAASCKVDKITEMFERSRIETESRMKMGGFERSTNKKSHPRLRRVSSEFAAKARKHERGTSKYRGFRKQRVVFLNVALETQ